MQILGKYEKAYLASCRQYVAERERVVARMAEISALRVIPSQGNFLLCEIVSGMPARKLAASLLECYSILVKECGKKLGLEGRNFIRIALRNSDDNDKLLNALRELLS